MGKSRTSGLTKTGGLLASGNLGDAIERYSYDELKNMGFDLKNPDYFLYDVGTEYKLDDVTINKINSKKVSFGDKIDVNRKVEISEWSLGGSNGKTIVKGKTVKTMTVKTSVLLSSLNTMNLSIKKDLLDGKSYVTNYAPKLNQLGRGFVRNGKFYFTYN